MSAVPEQAVETPQADNGILAHLRTLWLFSGGVVVLIAAMVKLLVHLYASRHYGYFTDELYYLDCARHLAWGYVDQPPLIAVMTWLSTVLFGESLQAIRFFPALAGVGKILLTGLIARELGGGRFAQGLASLSVLLAPGFLGIDNLLSMNAYEPLFWLGCAYMVLRIVNGGSEKLWLAVGVLAGLGLENKHSMMIFGFGLMVGLVLTREAALLSVALVLARDADCVSHLFAELDLEYPESFSVS